MLCTWPQTIHLLRRMTARHGHDEARCASGGKIPRQDLGGNTLDWQPPVKGAMALHDLHVAARSEPPTMTSHAVHMTARSTMWLRQIMLCTWH